MRTPGTRFCLIPNQAGRNHKEPEMILENETHPANEENTPARLLETTLVHGFQDPIITTINGKEFPFTTGQDKTLLRLLREEAGNGRQRGLRQEEVAVQYLGWGGSHELSGAGSKSARCCDCNN